MSTELDYPGKTRATLSARRSTQTSHEDNNPCLLEQTLSYKCLSDNAYDRDKCSVYFQNYRNCKGYWDGIIRERRRKGVKPYVPDAVEQEKLREEFRKKWYSDSSS